MVSQGVGSIFRRKDGRYFISLPKGLVEDTAFPFPTEKSVKVKIRFMPSNKKQLIEEYQQNINRARVNHRKSCLRRN